MQVFGSKCWVEVGDVQHLTTSEMRVCFVNPENLLVHHKPEVVTFPEVSTERAELENFARAIEEKRPLAVAGGDEEHGAAVFEAILKSAKSGKTVRVAATRQPAKAKRTAQAAKSARKITARRR